jgi:ADP-ribose pyrophosphatase
MRITKEDRTHSEYIYKGHIISLRLDKVMVEKGAERKKEIVEHNGGVVIACRPDPQQIILVKQYRYPIDESLYELPAGTIEVGEKPEVCAARELIEETGYKASKWAKLAEMYSAPGFCTELLYAYEASDVEFVGANPDEDEEIDIKILPLQTAWAWVVDGRIRDAKTIAVLGMLR